VHALAIHAANMQNLLLMFGAEPGGLNEVFDRSKDSYAILRVGFSTASFNLFRQIREQSMH